MGIFSRRQPDPSNGLKPTKKDKIVQCDHCGRWLVALPDGKPSWHEPVGRKGTTCDGARGI